ncbi:MAG: hypothetical protein KC912_21310 [Proteobacteria bacterium]|nr:hypothetical protein [Pseudomonadota bacterium]
MRALLLLLLSSTAIAGEAEVDFEIRSTASSDASFDRFNNANGFGTWGLRGAYPIIDGLKVAGSWSHGGRGVRTHMGEEAFFESQLKVETFGLGLKQSWLYRDIIGPVGTVQGLLLWGTGRFDEVPGVHDNPGQYVRRGTSFGLSATAGVEVRIPVETVAPAASLEFGYLTTSQMKLGELGDLRFGGLVVRGAVGARF